MDNNWIFVDEYEKFGINFQLREMKIDNITYQRYQAYLPYGSPCWPCCGKTEKEAVQELKTFIDREYKKAIKNKEAYENFMENTKDE